jgi:nitroreductase
VSTSAKTAPTLPAVHELIRNRWSPRAFSEQSVSAQDLATILDAGRWAASSYNEQPWRFIVAPKEHAADFQKLLGLLVPFNQAWAKSAAVLMLIVAKKTFTHNSTPNGYALHDAGAALATMALQATSLGIYVHGMAGFDHDRARTEIGIPDDFAVAAFAALGYLGSPDQLPEGARQQELAPRTRKPLSELAFTTAWQAPLPLS